MTGPAFSLGESEHERVEVFVSGYERQPSGDYHDDNWLTVEVALAVGDRKSTRLNSSHTVISYAVFCLKKKKKLTVSAAGTILAASSGVRGAGFHGLSMSAA